MKTLNNWNDFINESKKPKIFDEKDLVWTQAEKISPGDIHQYEDEDGKTKLSTVKKVVPFKNGFKEIVGATITWEDGKSELYRGDLQIQKKKNKK